MIEKYFDADKNMLYVKNFGCLDFESMKSYFSGLSEHTNQTKTLFILEDARDGDVQFDISHIDELAKVLSELSEKYIHVHHAVLLENARNVAYAMLINDGISKGSYKLRVFFNQTEAEAWLSPDKKQ
jgi:hypothetical protein